MVVDKEIPSLSFLNNRNCVISREKVTVVWLHNEKRGYVGKCAFLVVGMEMSILESDGSQLHTMP